MNWELIKKLLDAGAMLPESIVNAYKKHIAEVESGKAA